MKEKERLIDRAASIEGNIKIIKNIIDENDFNISYSNINNDFLEKEYNRAIESVEEVINNFAEKGEMILTVSDEYIEKSILKLKPYLDEVDKSDFLRVLISASSLESDYLKELYDYLDKYWDNFNKYKDIILLNNSFNFTKKSKIYNGYYETRKILSNLEITLKSYFKRKDKKIRKLSDYQYSFKINETVYKVSAYELMKLCSEYFYFDIKNKGFDEKEKFMINMIIKHNDNLLLIPKDYIKFLADNYRELEFEIPNNFLDIDITNESDNLTEKEIDLLLLDEKEVRKKYKIIEEPKIEITQEKKDNYVSAIVKCMIRELKFSEMRDYIQNGLNIN